MAGEKEKTRQRFIAAFMTCWEIFNKTEPSETVIATYYKSLERYTIEEIEKAFSNAIGSLKWFPKPSELATLTGDPDTDLLAGDNLEREAEIQAQLLFEGLKQDCRRAAFADPVTELLATKRFKSQWANLLENENSYFLHDFKASYKAHKKNEVLALKAIDNLKIKLIE